jgi:hypothetical protein
MHNGIFFGTVTCAYCLHDVELGHNTYRFLWRGEDVCIIRCTCPVCYLHYLALYKEGEWTLYEIELEDAMLLSRDQRDDWFPNVMHVWEL